MCVCVSVCVRDVWVTERLVLYLVVRPASNPALFLLHQATQLPGRPARPPARPSGARGRAGSRPAGRPAYGHGPSVMTQPAWLGTISIPLAAQTAVKQLSKFNHCHLSHFKEDTGKPSVFLPAVAGTHLPTP